MGHKARKKEKFIEDFGGKS